MKATRFFPLTLFLGIALFAAGCSTNANDEHFIPETPVPEKPIGTSSDSIIITLKAGGEVLLSQEPLTRTGTNDLYALNVQQSINPLDDYTGRTRYAYGYFDNLSNIELVLAKNMYYHFELAYIPNGKNLVHQYPDGHYGNPCNSHNGQNGKLNEVMYSTVAYIGMITTGSTQGKGITSPDLDFNMFNTIERYQGLFINYKATDLSTSVTIDLYRMMTGVKLIVDDFTEGVVSVSTRYGIVHSVRPSATSTTNILDVIVEMPFMSSILFLSTVNYTSGNFILDPQIAEMFVKYTGTDGKSRPLYANENFEYKRLTKHILRFSISDAINNNGMTIIPNIIDDPNGELQDGGWTW